MHASVHSGLLATGSMPLPMSLNPSRSDKRRRYFRSARWPRGRVALDDRSPGHRTMTGGQPFAGTNGRETP